MKAKSRNGQPGALKAALRALERKLLVDALQRSGTIREAAKLLGSTSKRVDDLMRRHGIQRTVKVQRAVKLIFKKN